MKWLAFIIALALLATSAYAKEWHMTLLAVTETDGGYRGSTADLYVEVRPGTGRIFMETFPLTKFDTQISTRFAKEVACSVLSVDCSQLDFFYTIRAESAIVGGPSAGAPIAALTAAALENLAVDESISTTGTINSGGVIGPVGGLKQKIQAAASKGLKKVLVPRGELSLAEGNSTLENFGSEDAVAYGRRLGIEIIEVADLYDALSQMTGKSYDFPNIPVEPNQDYLRIMKGLALDLCNRSSMLARSLSVNVHDPEAMGILTSGENLSQKGQEAFAQDSYYSAASYCFGANIKYSYLSVLGQNLSVGDMQEMRANTEASIRQFRNALPKYSTITGLETYAVVMERLIESLDSLNQSSISIALDKKNDASYQLAYALERFRSAASWSSFFQMPSAELTFNEEALKQGCLSKLAEAEERNQYVQLYFPGQEQDNPDLAHAYEQSSAKDYELCIFMASKAKADADVILGGIGVGRDQVESILDNKLEITRRVIATQIAKGMFPIIGYSYYEYALSLKETDPYSAMLYSEYSLELSNLDMYFEGKGKTIPRQYALQRQDVWYFLVGAGSGVFLTLAFLMGFEIVRRLGRPRARVQQKLARKGSKTVILKKRK